MNGWVGIRDRLKYVGIINSSNQYNYILPSRLGHSPYSGTFLQGFPIRWTVGSYSGLVGGPGGLAAVLAEAVAVGSRRFGSAGPKIAAPRKYLLVDSSGESRGSTTLTSNVAMEYTLFLHGIY